MTENNLKTQKLVNFGPSGRAVAQPMDLGLLDNLFEHSQLVRLVTRTLKHLFPT